MTAPAYAQPIAPDESDGIGLVVRAVDKHGKPITEWPKVNQWFGYDAHGLTMISTLWHHPIAEQQQYVERARTLHKDCVAGERCRLAQAGNQE